MAATEYCPVHGLRVNEVPVNIIIASLTCVMMHPPTIATFAKESNVSQEKPHTMKKVIVMLSVVSAAWLCSCNNNENENNKMAEDANKEAFNNTAMENDAEFATKAATGGMMEVELGKIAMSNASMPAVSQFGQTMVNDHGKANEELKSTAQAKGITLPDMPDNDKQKMIDDLREKKGHDFDKDYIDMMVKDHKEDIDLFEKEAEKGNDADLKAWANAKLPTLREHLRMAESIQNDLKNMK